MTRDFDGKAALVTGAGSGIGRAVALHYARGAGRVVVSDVVVAGGEETARRTREAFGRLDVAPVDGGYLAR